MKNSEGLDWLIENNMSGVHCTLDELLLYQRYTHLLRTKPISRVKHHMSGQYLAKTKGRGMEFDEARHYQPGDDVRTIDWRVTARTGKTHTKIFREEKDRPIFIMCDLLPSMNFGSQLLFKSVQACHLASLVAWKGKQNGDKVGGLIITDDELIETKPRARQQALLHWLNQLSIAQQPAKNDNFKAANESSPQADLQNSAEEKFERACRHLRQVAHPGSLIYIISDFQHINDAALQHLFQLQRHCEINACWIYDPIEQLIPDEAVGLSLTNGSEVKSLTESAQIEQYNQSVQALFEERKKAVQKLNIKWLPISAGLPLHIQL